MRLSNSKANTWRRCPKKFQFKYELGLRPKVKGLPLTRGDWIHQMLQTHYEGRDWKGTHQDLTKQFYTLFEEEREELGDLPAETNRIMRSYLRRYKKEDKQYRVVDVELDEIVVLKPGLKFNFIIDLIVEDELGSLWLWDHKTVKNFMDEDFKLLDAQLARYFWAAEVMGYTPLKGVLFNEIRTKPPAIPQELKDGSLSKRKKIDTDYWTFATEIKRRGLDPAPYSDILHRLRQDKGRFFRRTTLPKDKRLTHRTMVELADTAREIQTAQRRNRFPRTVSKTCSWDCEYLDLCVTEYFGGDTSSLIKANFEVKD